MAMTTATASRIAATAEQFAFLAREAREALPRECCGLVEGFWDGSELHIVALHPARNIASETDAFEIDPQTHFALLRALRGSRNRIIGCYHSHPDGIAVPSLRDQQAAAEDGFLWLIAAIAGDGFKLAGFIFPAGTFVEVPIHRSLRVPA